MHISSPLLVASTASATTLTQQASGKTCQFTAQVWGYPNLESLPLLNIWTGKDAEQISIRCPEASMCIPNGVHVPTESNASMVLRGSLYATEDSQIGL